MKTLTSVCALLAMACPVAQAATASCKSNIERFNAALTPFVNITGTSMTESIRHAGWMAQEMAYAVRHGCEPGRYADERAQLQEFENQVQETIRTCQQATTGGDCSPKQHFSSSAYRRPDLVRPSSEGAGSNTDRSSGTSGTRADSVGDGTGADRQSRSGAVGGRSESGPVPSPQAAVDLARAQQERAEEQRQKDKRRRNYPELDASACLTPIEGRPGFTGFRNSCSYPVRYTYCVESPDSGTGASFVDCSKQSGAGTVPAGGEDFAHMKGGDRVHHVGCKPPGTAVTRQFEGGRLYADCAKLGGN